MYYFFALYNNRKSFQMSTIHSNRKCSKVVEISLDILGNVRTSSENRRKSSEVVRTFSVIPLMTRPKSHAFDSEKVGRHTFDVLGLIFQRKLTLSCPFNIQSFYFISVIR